ncbi:zinc finger CCHC domain-containing protein 24-like [Choristoneura fumiferana]|uniref:zinc finger CCHC domain-containing protein 24-like n=1 Tax=Choristoneura fumiferana TaxID=7141 RepID=UPI003D15DB2D
MGCYFSKRSTGLRCRQCNSKNVNNVFERLCYECATEARRPVSQEGSQKPCFGEYRCGACGRSWTSRLCWPRNYQSCMRCRQPVYPYNWRELTPLDKMNAPKQEHQREYCQKCQEVGYYCGNYARLHEKLQKE